MKTVLLDIEKMKRTPMVRLHKRETEATQAPDSSVAVSPAGFQILPPNSPAAPGPLLGLGSTLVMCHSPLLQAFA